MRLTLARVVEAALVGAVTWLGIRLGQTLSDPYSDLRLRLGELVDRAKEVRK